jgi:predicted Rossmann fold nucleotide-binding protein DprA/Smf involved in DNA uptake
MEEELRSGTWATVRYARRIGRPITLLFPDGGVLREGL